jgi:hypothetical protein
MAWWLVSLQTIGVTIISAWIAYIVSNWQKKLDYVYDYRKYILGKRKQAYDNIELLISTLKKNVVLEDGQSLNYMFYITIDKTHPVLEFNRAFANILEYDIWLSHSMYKACKGLSEIISKVIHEIASNNPTQKLLKDVGLKYQNELVNFKTQMIEIFAYDISKLDDVDEFKKSLVNVTSR